MPWYSALHPAWVRPLPASRAGSGPNGSYFSRIAYLPDVADTKPDMSLTLVGSRAPSLPSCRLLECATWRRLTRPPAASARPSASPVTVAVSRWSRPHLRGLGRRDSARRRDHLLGRSGQGFPSAVRRQ